MKACLLAVLLLAVACHAAKYGESCTADKDCTESRMECVFESGSTTPQSTTQDFTSVESTSPETDDFVPRRHLLTLGTGEGKCECSESYTYIEKKCRLELNEDLTCEIDDDCELIVESPIYDKSTSKGVCGDDKTCDCKGEWVVGLNDTVAEYMCYQLPTLEENSDPPIYNCEVNQQCVILYDDLRNTTAACNTSSICTCDGDWKIYTDDSDDDNVKNYCARPLGTACDNSEQCSHVGDADCIDSKCKCKDGFTDDGDFKCNGSSALASSVFMLLAAFWLTKESQ